LLASNQIKTNDNSSVKATLYQLPELTAQHFRKHQEDAGISQKSFPNLSALLVIQCLKYGEYINKNINKIQNVANL